MSAKQEAGVPPRLCSAKRAARELGVPYTSLRDLAFRGELPVVKFGSRWYFERADLDRLVASHKECIS
jgi:excisionase family DNA binding protein